MSVVQKKVAKSSGTQAERTKQPANEVAPQNRVLELQQGAGNQALVGLLSAGVVQRKEKDSASAESRPEPAAAAPSLIVEDEAQEVKPGQMRKSDFLAQLRLAVCSTAEEALAGTMWSTMGCPHIERWLDHYSQQPSAYLERALRKYAPETASARSAQEYIPLVTRRVRRGIEEWRSTGEVKDLPPEFAAGGMPGATVSGLMGGLLSGVGSAISGLIGGIGSAMSGLVSGAGKALASVGSMLFKRHEGAEAERTEDPAAIRAQLGGGQALEGATQRRMQSAFGTDFAGVRVHTDTRARELTEGMQARAFTVGNDIAFGGDEYRPGTPVGDALIAHELAHVVQQGGGNAAGGAQHKGGNSGSLEEDADRSAVGAVVKLWSGARGELSQLGQQAMPGLRSGLRLQRCAGSPKQSTTPVALSGDWAKDVKTATDKKDEAMMLALVKKALEPKFTVELAGNSSSDQESPDDYKKTPVINFDPNLNRKKKHGKNKVMTQNAGHSFDSGKDVYAILGPNALKPSSPLNTVMVAEHELYHTTHHLGAAKPKPEKPKPGDKPLTKEEKKAAEDQKDASEEVETYSNDFINYFHLLGSIRRGPDGGPMYFGESWLIMLDQYAKAEPAAQQAAVKKIAAYYQKPPASITAGVAHHPTNAAEVQDTFKRWLERRGDSEQMIADLKAALNL